MVIAGVVDSSFALATAVVVAAAVAAVRKRLGSVGRGKKRGVVTDPDRAFFVKKCLPPTLP